MTHWYIDPRRLELQEWRNTRKSSKGMNGGATANVQGRRRPFVVSAPRHAPGSAHKSQCGVVGRGRRMRTLASTATTSGLSGSPRRIRTPIKSVGLSGSAQRVVTPLAQRNSFAGAVERGSPISFGNRGAAVSTVTNTVADANQKSCSSNSGGGGSSGVNLKLSQRFNTHVVQDELIADIFSGISMQQPTTTPSVSASAAAAAAVTPATTVSAADSMTCTVIVPNPTPSEARELCEGGGGDAEANLLMGTTGTIAPTATANSTAAADDIGGAAMAAQTEQKQGHYSALLLRTSQLLHSMCDTWEGNIDSAEAVNTDAAEDIRVVIGQTHLLLNRKMTKFQTLCDREGLFAADGRSTETSDLEGYWEGCILPQVRDVESRFARLERLRVAGWNNDEVQVQAPKKVKKTQTPKARARRTAAKKAKSTKKVKVTSAGEAAPTRQRVGAKSSSRSGFFGRLIAQQRRANRGACLGSPQVQFHMKATRALAHVVASITTPKRVSFGSLPATTGTHLRTPLNSGSGLGSGPLRPAVQTPHSSRSANSYNACVGSLTVPSTTTPSSSAKLRLSTTTATVSTPTLLPVRASRVEREEMGSDVYLTPVRRSTRTTPSRYRVESEMANTPGGLAGMLESVGYAYKPNPALLNGAVTGKEEVEEEGEEEEEEEEAKTLEEFGRPRDLFAESASVDEEENFLLSPLMPATTTCDAVVVASSSSSSTSTSTTLLPASVAAAADDVPFTLNATATITPRRSSRLSRISGLSSGGLRL